jgi:hypothetical protein
MSDSIVAINRQEHDVLRRELNIEMCGDRRSGCLALVDRLDAPVA